ncbi:MAG: hypothetical protein RL685_6363 [Pseudomonadota bacterium]|jgi:hypothetical protein
MKDSKTLLSSDATAFERQLLGAAAAERPSPELQLRMQQAIGIGPLPPPGPDTSIGRPERGGTYVAPKAVASGWAAGTWLKVVLGVGVGAGLIAGGLALRSSEPAPLTRSSPPAAETPTQAAPVEAPTRSAPSAPVSGELREEIDLLDRVRAALDRRDARAASALLENYAQRFPEGELAREAAALRARSARVTQTAR